MVFRILVASYTNEVYTLLFDPDAPSLTLGSSVTVGHHPSWITPHPTDPTVIFAAVEQGDGRLVALKYDSDGNGKVVANVPTLGDSPCSILSTEQGVLIGNYMSGTVVTVPLASEPNYLAPSGNVVVKLTGSGPNQERQASPHPHQAVIHPDREELLVPDLGSDKLRRFAKDGKGGWVPSIDLEYKAGTGPRHIAFYKDNLYTLLELSSEIVAHRFPPLPEEPMLLDTVPTMQEFPPPPAVLDMLAAEILIPKPNEKYSIPYLYVSNRNDPSPEGDVISIYSIENPEKIVPVNEVRSGLKHARGMVFGGPDDKYLIAGGVLGGGVKIFERINGGKDLKEIVRVALDAPTGFLWN
ncbi:putative isomerase YbhE [Abortiporus biennis]|nr:putative isomerase YbhE [Abortiporus biennis]